jgi:hypothetical protein
MVDVGFHNRAIRAQLATFGHLELGGQLGESDG